MEVRLGFNDGVIEGGSDFIEIGLAVGVLVGTKLVKCFVGLMDGPIELSIVGVSDKSDISFVVGENVG